MTTHQQFVKHPKKADVAFVVLDEDMQEALKGFYLSLRETRGPKQAERQTLKMVQFGLYDSEKEIVEPTKRRSVIQVLEAELPVWEEPVTETETDETTETTETPETDPVTQDVEAEVFELNVVNA